MTDEQSNTSEETSQEEISEQAPASETQETTAQAEPASQEEQFFDPREVPEELKGAYKQMQRAFTKKTQALAEQRKKVEAYDQFMRDPVASLRQVAQQYGLTISEARAMQQQAQQDQTEGWQPETWEDVMSQAEQRVMARMQRQFEPFFSQVRDMKKSQLEERFDAEFPAWREYEDEMSTVLNKHPSLVNDPDALLRAAVPREVFESAATQRALRKLQAKAEHAKIGGGSTVQKPATAKPNGPIPFSEAVRIAKAQLAEQGIRQ